MIRAMKKEEIPVCVDVICRSFRTVAERFGFTKENAPRFTAFAMSEERLCWQFEHEKRSMYVWDEQGSIVGYCSLTVQHEGICELHNLAVLPSCRHREIGSKILCYVLEEAKKCGCRRIKIGIVEENMQLKNWYMQHGFVPIGTEKFDFFPFTCGYMEYILTECSKKST